MGENTDYAAADLTQEEHDSLERSRKDQPTGYSENGDYEAAPAFDSPEEEMKYYQEHPEGEPDSCKGQ